MLYLLTDRELLLLLLLRLLLVEPHDRLFVVLEPRVAFVAIVELREALVLPMDSSVVLVFFKVPLYIYIYIYI